MFMSNELRGKSITQFRTLFNLCASPYSNLEDVLKLVFGVVPSVAITEFVRGQIVVYAMFAAAAVGKYVICLPFA